MNMKKVLLIFMFLAIIPFALSVGVSPPSIDYVFQPNLSGDAHFYFRNNLDKDTTIIGHIGGELAAYANITSQNAILLKPQERGYVDLVFALPDSIGSPGLHSFSVIATEAEGSGGTVGAKGEVVVPVRFFVQYPGKMLGLKLNAEDAGVGGDVNLKLTVSNLGTEAVENASATIDILKGTEKIGSVSVDSISAGIMENKVVETKWNTGNAEQGIYLANAALDYGAGKAFANDTFRIGTFDLDVINYTKKAASRSVSKFLIEVESKWNQDIDNIFADAKVMRNGSVLTTFSAATPLLKAWEKKNLSGFLDAASLENGVYDLQIDLRFSSGGSTKTKTVNGQIELVGKEEIKNEAETPVEKPAAKPAEINSLMSYLTTTNILIIIVVILVIINVIILLRKKKSKDEEEYV